MSWHVLSPKVSVRIIWSVAAAVLAIQTAACVAIEVSSTKRQQDSDAAKEMRRLLKAEKDYRLQAGRYSEILADLDGSFTRLKRDEQCSAGYCYGIKLSPTGYEIHARPQAPGKSGYRSFYGDETGVLRYSVTQNVANGQDRPLY
jgi:hypothetical protein